MAPFQQFFWLILTLKFVKTEGQNCPDPFLAHGRFRLKQRGHFVSYKCRRPFRLIGSDKGMCLNGAWHHGSLAPPTCVRAGCSLTPIPTIENGELEILYRGALVTVTCHPGHVISGSPNKVRKSRKFSRENTTGLFSLKVQKNVLVVAKMALQQHDVAAYLVKNAFENLEISSNCVNENIFGDLSVLQRLAEAHSGFNHLREKRDSNVMIFYFHSICYGHFARQYTYI